jgi:predicted anti-sigma-YlaC factor YlaD
MGAMGRLRSIRTILTLTCDDSSRLLSDDLDRSLTRSERAALRIHLLICGSCRRFRRQIRFLHELMHGLHEDPEAAGDSLPPLTPAERDRIHTAVRKARRK